MKSAPCTYDNHAGCALRSCTCDCHRYCGKLAAVRQQMTHAARLRRLREHASPSAAERWVCEEHADIIDLDWIVVGCVNLGDVESVLRWADKKCEYATEDDECQT